MVVIGFPGGRATLMETAPGLRLEDVGANIEAELVVGTTTPPMVF
jgi:acetate CoA/acetoacetate CoA-transferase beta subunit